MCIALPPTNPREVRSRGNTNFLYGPRRSRTILLHVGPICASEETADVFAILILSAVARYARVPLLLPLRYFFQVSLFDLGHLAVCQWLRRNALLREVCSSGAVAIRRIAIPHDGLHALRRWRRRFGRNQRRYLSEGDRSPIGSIRPKSRVRVADSSFRLQRAVRCKCPDITDESLQIALVFHL